MYTFICISIFKYIIYRVNHILFLKNLKNIIIMRTSQCNILKVYFLFCLLPMCMHVCMYTCVYGCSQRPEKGVKSPEAGIIGFVSSLICVLRTKLHSLEEQQDRSATELSLQIAPELSLHLLHITHFNEYF